MVLVLLALISLAAAFASERSAGRVLGLVFAALGIMLIVPVALKELAQLLGFGCMLLGALAYMVGARSWSRSLGMWALTLLLFAALWKPIAWFFAQGLKQIPVAEVGPFAAVLLMVLGVGALLIGAREHSKRPQAPKARLIRTRRRAALAPDAEPCSDVLPAAEQTKQGDELGLFGGSR